MSSSRNFPLSLKPIISYPREAQVGKNYLLTVDLQSVGEGNKWEYEVEEYPIYCRLETAPLFRSKAVGEPAIVLHRFGGSYGAAKFLLTAAQQELEGEIKITLVNGWGVPMRVLNLRSVRVRQQANLSVPSLLELEKEVSEPEEQLLNQQVAAILVIGGAEDKVHGKEILQTFFQRSGGTDALIGIIPCASREPALIGERYYRLFSDMGAREIKVLDVRDRSGADDSAYRNFIENCTGVFLSGGREIEPQPERYRTLERSSGDQLRLCGLLADTPLMNRIVERAQRGEISLAGTSAGAMVMGHHMIAGGGSGEPPNPALVDMARGLSIIPGVIVDSSFFSSNRMARLLSAMASHPELLGIGIDEDTCALFKRDGLLRVIGKSTVTIIDSSELTYTNQSEISGMEPWSLHNLRVHILTHGDSYDLRKSLLLASRVNGVNSVVPFEPLSLHNLRVHILTHGDSYDLYQRLPYVANNSTRSSGKKQYETSLLVIGGAEDKVHGKEILQTFFQRSGGTDALIGIIPCASREPVLIGERYYRLFSDMGAREIKVLDVRDRSGADDSAYRNFIENCTGVFFTGGDQLRLCGLLADTPLMNRIVERAQRGEISLAGTSAGAMVMGHHMIAGGGSGEPPNPALVDMAMGLRIIPEVIVDSSFFNSNRMARLLSAMASHPELLGIGIDEDTCALFERDGLLRVIGKSTVTIIDASQMTR